MRGMSELPQSSQTSIDCNTQKNGLELYSNIRGRFNDEFTCHQIIRELCEMNMLEVPHEGYIPTYTRTNFTDALHDSFGFRTDYQIVTTQQMKKFLRTPKNKIYCYIFAYRKP